MAQRYYCPQVHDSMKGYIDLPSLASKKEKEANDNAKAFAENNRRICRVIRKPHGWEPSHLCEAGNPKKRKSNRMSAKAYLTVFINPKTLVVENVRILSDNLATCCGQISAIVFEMDGESFHDANERRIMLD